MPSKGGILQIIVSVYERRSCPASLFKGSTCLRHKRSQSVIFRVAPKQRGRLLRRRVDRPSKQAWFIAIEKRITTRHREAQALTMPVTCHHCFEPCRHVLSSKLAGTHPPSTYLHISPFACRSATTNEHHTMLNFGSNRLYSSTCNSNSPLQSKDEPCMQAICPINIRVFAVHVVIDLSPSII